MKLNQWSRRYEPLSLSPGEDEREFQADELDEYLETIDPIEQALDDAIEQLYSDDVDDRSPHPQAP
jgi:hypothetical protein